RSMAWGGSSTPPSIKDETALHDVTTPTGSSAARLDEIAQKSELPRVEDGVDVLDQPVLRLQHDQRVEAAVPERQRPRPPVDRLGHEDHAGRGAEVAQDAGGDPVSADLHRRQDAFPKVGLSCDVRVELPHQGVQVTAGAG